MEGRRAKISIYWDERRGRYVAELTDNWGRVSRHELRVKQAEFMTQSLGYDVIAIVEAER